MYFIIVVGATLIAGEGLEDGWEGVGVTEVVGMGVVYTGTEDEALGWEPVVTTQLFLKGLLGLDIVHHLLFTNELDAAYTQPVMAITTNPEYTYVNKGFFDMSFYVLYYIMIKDN